MRIGLYSPIGGEGHPVCALPDGFNTVKLIGQFRHDTPHRLMIGVFLTGRRSGSVTCEQYYRGYKSN